MNSRSYDPNFFYSLSPELKQRCRKIAIECSRLYRRGEISEQALFKMFEQKLYEIGIKLHGSERKSVHWIAAKEYHKKLLRKALL